METPFSSLPPLSGSVHSTGHAQQSGRCPSRDTNHVAGRKRRLKARSVLPFNAYSESPAESYYLDSICRDVVGCGPRRPDVHAGDISHRCVQCCHAEGFGERRNWQFEENVFRSPSSLSADALAASSVIGIHRLLQPIRFTRDNTSRAFVAYLRITGRESK